jgi:DNA-3-methyladenine glycosylase
MIIIEREFFDRPTLTVARELLGQRLVREIDGRRLSGLIVETEAYIGPHDSANHASRGRTARTEVIFGPPGRTYIYFVYGMHYMLNLVTEPAGFPAAVLIRAVEPVEGLELMQSRRQGVKSKFDLTNGPGKLCQALAIDKTLHNWDVSLGQRLWLERGDTLPDSLVATGSRIGIAYARPEDQRAPWRFWRRGNPFVSRLT